MILSLRMILCFLSLSHNAEADSVVNFRCVDDSNFLRPDQISFTRNDSR
jgi:hypothetical protein